MLNVIAVMGRLVADPELRKTSNGISTTTFTIACDRNFVKSGTERQTDFFDVVAWRSTAEFVSKYFRKGQMIVVNGWLQTRTYEDKEGKKRKVYEIVAETINFADSKGTGAGAPQGEGMAPRAPMQETTAYSSGSDDEFAVIDDSEDLPF